MMMKAKGQECKQLVERLEQIGMTKERLVQRRPFHCYEDQFQSFYGSFYQKFAQYVYYYHHVIFKTMVNITTLMSFD